MYYTTLTFFSVSSFLRTVVKLNSYGAIALEVNGGYHGDVIVLEFDHPVAVVMSADLQARYHMAFGIGPPTSDQERTMFNTMNYDESQPTKMSFVFDLTSCDAQRTGLNHFGGRYLRGGFVTMMKQFVSQLKRPVESDSNDGDNMDDCEGGSPRAEAKCDLKKRKWKSRKEGENEQYQSNQKKPRTQKTMLDFLGFPTRL